ncbi:MAG: chitin disaccharide deacetylase [Bacillota bacterium]|jgi:predicted glycoside hydrolase/deacetylase ChbG (UPF0249 family)
MRLIVNGDDFGYSPGQNYGIVEAYQKGILRSTSLMAGGMAAAQALELARANPGLGVGVHLVLDHGRPLSPPQAVPSLVAEDGTFRRPAFEGPLDLSPAEVEQEWRAQILWVLDRGVQPTHLDGHHHFHLHPQLFPVTCRLAGEFDLPIRTLPFRWADGGPFAELAKLRHPDVSLVDFYGPGVEEGFFTNFFAAYPQLRDKTVEVMCHPAYLDDYLLEASSYTLPRVRELQVLKSSAVAQWVRENDVQLINYREL